MPDRPSASLPPAPLFDAADEDAVAYRGFSSLAALGLVAGLLSPLALCGTLFWLMPVTAVVMSALALRQIAAQAPNVAGRGAALAGLALGLAFLVATAADNLVYRWFVRREARQFAAEWIEVVQNGEIYKAQHLMIEPKRRMPLDGPLAEFYRHSGNYRTELMTFLDRPVVKTLFALGKNAQYRFYETAAEGGDGGNDYVESTYAVTFNDENGQKKTFFITLTMARGVDQQTGRAAWMLVQVQGNVRPSGW